ncbi:MAG: DUF3365 domain-containing protein [Coriobacteriaceae bacterium]|jgi:signal transduction histidine kinase|nr:DUF3365 domain-containing protein [Coriobacteriaceae bacterium]
MRDQAEAEMLEKTRILSHEMQASWEFFSINQRRIDTDANGEYNFKGIYCAVASKSIAKMFMRDTDYIIRYFSKSPRNVQGTMDAFEDLAFKGFSEFDKMEDYYQLTEYQDTAVFRYVSPIYVEESCLECHGGPVGELDVTGYPKEGLKEGELIGGISIIMPVDLYMSGVQNNIVRQSIFFFGLILAVSVVVFIAFSRLVTRPLKQLEDTTEHIEQGRFDIDVRSVKATGEIWNLARRIEVMSSQLKTMYDNLERQVQDRTEELASANKILEEQRCALEQANEFLQHESEYKSDFLAIMSHELRTPLTAILAYIEIWEGSNQLKGSAEQEAIHEIRESAQVLLQMVNNILMAARSEAGKNDLHLEHIDMVDLIDSVRFNLGFLAAKRRLRFETSVSGDVPIIHADWEKLNHILENLGSNAIKFTKRGGQVSIAVEYDQAEDFVVIKVSDTGIGIKEDELPSIFERFTQIDRSAFRRYKGSGLGLSVVREFVRAHQGRIEVESTYKQGSTFTVYLPVAASDAHQAPNAEDGPGLPDAIQGSTEGRTANDPGSVSGRATGNKGGAAGEGADGDAGGIAGTAADIAAGEGAGGAEGKAAGTTSDMAAGEGAGGAEGKAAGEGAGTTSDIAAGEGAGGAAGEGADGSCQEETRKAP